MAPEGGEGRLDLASLWSEEDIEAAFLKLDKEPRPKHWSNAKKEAWLKKDEHTLPASEVVYICAQICTFVEENEAAKQDQAAAAEKEGSGITPKRKRKMKVLLILVSSSGQPHFHH